MDLGGKNDVEVAVLEKLSLSILGLFGLNILDVVLFVLGRGLFRKSWNVDKEGSKSLMFFLVLGFR